MRDWKLVVDTFVVIILFLFGGPNKNKLMALRAAERKIFAISVSCRLYSAESGFSIFSNCFCFSWGANLFFSTAFLRSIVGERHNNWKGLTRNGLIGNKSLSHNYLGCTIFEASFIERWEKIIMYWWNGISTTFVGQLNMELLFCSIKRSPTATRLIVGQSAL